MPKLKPHTVLDISLPEKVVDEAGAVSVPLGQTAYWLCLTDAEVELIVSGIVTEAVSRRAFALTHWKRESNRVTSRQLQQEG